MSYDLYLIRRDDSRTIDDDLPDQLIESPLPEDQAFVARLTPQVERMLEERCAGADGQPLASSEDGLILVSLTYGASGNAFESMMSSISAIAEEIGAAIYDPQSGEVIEGPVDHATAEARFEQGRDVLRDITGGVAKRRPWWKFW